MQRYEEITEQVRNKRKFMRNKKGTLPGRIPFSKMREMGLEPTRAYTHKILSLACLPIPALPHSVILFASPTKISIPQSLEPGNHFFQIFLIFLTIAFFCLPLHRIYKIIEHQTQCDNPLPAR